MYEILLFLFSMHKKKRKREFGQGSIYNQQMSKCIFVINCSFEKRNKNRMSREMSSSSSSTILSYFSN